MDELISDFLTETTEGLETLDNEIVQLEKNPSDQGLLGSIFRVMHTIKGTCGFLGLPRLESVAHAGENILDKMRDGELEATPGIISLILECIDTIKAIIEHIEAEEVEPEGNDSELIARVNQAAEGGPVVGPGGAAEAEPAAEEAPAVEEMPVVEEEAPAMEEPAPVVEEAPTDLPTPTASADEEDEIDFTPVPAGETGNLELNPGHLAITPSDDVEAAAEDVPADAPPAEDPAEEAEAPPAPADIVPAPEKKPEPALSEKAKKSAIEQGIKNLAKKETKASTGSQSIRVNLDVLENLMQMVSELVLTRNQLMQMVRGHKDSEFVTPLQRLSHITSELQEGVMQTRMQPIGNAWVQFPRLVRDLSQDLGKKIELCMVGEETELDRQLIESIKDPLTHMVRNSTDHGLEGPEERLSSGKPECGTVTLRAYHQGGHIIIEVSDDGRGLSVDKIKDKAINNGLATEEELATMTEQQIMQFIFKAGFSTAEKITSVSGRGVGMDVVKNNIEKISGTIELRSKVGQGSTFMIKIPLTLAIMPILVLECSGQKFGIPQISILEMVKVGQNSEHVIEIINGTPVLRLRNKLLPLIVLGEVLRLDTLSFEEKVETFIVVCEVGGYHFGIVVDRVYDTEEIVVKPVAPILKHIEVYSGSTLLGDGSVIMIVDPNGLAKAAGALSSVSDSTMTMDSRLLTETDTTSFLLFNSTGEVTPKAVPLELVSRLEEIDVKRIEYSGGQKVVQYRGALMRMVSLDACGTIPDEGLLQVIVFMDGPMIMGLIVETILDIVEHPISTQIEASKAGFIGSMVIKDKTTDLVDVGHFFNQVFGDMRDDPKIASNATDSSLPHVIFIDDSPFFRKFIPPALASAGYRVTAMESATEAVEVLQSNDPVHMIVTDLNMPGMSGYDLVQYCCSREELQHIPVIALSSNTTESTTNEASSLGVDAFIPKTNHDELLSVVSQLMSRKVEAMV